MPLSQIFVGYDATLLQLTSRGFCLYSLSFLVMGFNIFGLAFFTALNNVVISAIISFLRTLLFETTAILILPVSFVTDGIWLAVVVAELSAAIVTVAFYQRTATVSVSIIERPETNMPELKSLFIICKEAL